MYKIKVDTREVRDMLHDLNDMPDDVMKSAFKFYKKETPKKSGNARNKTTLRGDKIRSGYPYAGRLDEGWSKQSPDGMTEPTIEYMEKEVDRQVRKIGR